MRRPTRRWQLAGLLAALTLLAGYAALADAGGGDGDGDRTGEAVPPDDGGAGEAPTPAADHTAVVDAPAEGDDAPAVDDTVTTTSLEPVGEPVDRFTLGAGDCVNWYREIDLVTRVPCASPHDREVFHTAAHPAPFGEPHPGDQAMHRFAVQACYEQFEGFNGAPYETSELVITVITPTRATFEDPRARHRGITCLVSRQDGQPLVGSAAGRGL